MIENGVLDRPPSESVIVRLASVLKVEPTRWLECTRWSRADPQVRAQARAWRQQAQAKSGSESASSPNPLWSDAPPRDDGKPGRDLDALFRSGQLRRMSQSSSDRSSAADPPVNSPQASPDRDALPNAEEPAGLRPSVRPLSVVPLINKVAAGYPLGFTDLDYPARVADDYAPAPPGLDDPDAFAATVVGDSMAPDYRAGDVVVFAPALDVVDGSDCFVRLEPNHETTFKRVYLNAARGTVRLVPLNPAYPERELPRDRVAGLYRAVWRMSRLLPSPES